MFGAPGYRAPLSPRIAPIVMSPEVVAAQNYERMHRAAMARERRLFDKR
jgi:hypothetical protein